MSSFLFRRANILKESSNTPFSTEGKTSPHSSRSPSSTEGKASSESSNTYSSTQGKASPQSSNSLLPDNSCHPPDLESVKKVSLIFKIVWWIHELAWRHSKSFWWTEDETCKCLCSSSGGQNLSQVLHHSLLQRINPPLSPPVLQVWQKPDRGLTAP